MKKYLSIAALALCVAFVSSCNKKDAAPAAGGDMAKADSTLMKNKEGVKKWFDAFNNRKWDEFDNLMDANYIEHTTAPGQEAGVAGLKKMMASWVAAFPDVKMSIVDISAEGDKVAVLSRTEGTNTGAYMGKPATNKKVDVMGMDYIKIVNGKAVEHWGYMEEMKWMQQLGMVPDMGADMKKDDAKKK